jgi:hypothetical protein
MVRIGRTVETIGITFFTLKYWAWFGRRTGHPKKQKKTPVPLLSSPHFTAHPILINVSDWFNTHDLLLQCLSVHKVCQPHERTDRSHAGYNMSHIGNVSENPGAAVSSCELGLATFSD